MKKLTSWTAKRAGAFITISGLDAETQEPVKVVGVEVIDSGTNGGLPVATDKNGEQYELA